MEGRHFYPAEHEGPLGDVLMSDEVVEYLGSPIKATEVDDIISDEDRDQLKKYTISVINSFDNARLDDDSDNEPLDQAELRSRYQRLINYALEKIKHINAEIEERGGMAELVAKKEAWRTIRIAAEGQLAKLEGENIPPVEKIQRYLRPDDDV